MHRTGEFIINTGIVTALALGITACGEDKQPEAKMTKAEHEAEIERLSELLDSTRANLRAGEIAYETYLDELPPNCLTAIRPFIRPEGEFSYESSSLVALIVAPECSPNNTEAVDELNGGFNELENMQGRIGEIEWWIGANLAAIGVVSYSVLK